MSVRSVLYLPALILAGGLLFIVGAVVVLAYRDRRPGFSYFASEDHVAVALARRRASWRRPIQISCSEPSSGLFEAADIRGCARWQGPRHGPWKCGFGTGSRAELLGLQTTGPCRAIGLT